LNAVDFSPANGHIELAVRINGDNLEFIVEDNGPGIPDYAFGKIFDRFFSLQRPDTGKKSTGLGLNFVREVAVLHHGEIILENRPEGGARALLSLPLKI
ncbi:MAG: two-component system sensor histidine kinase CreC, partial [Desulfobacterales bacterium]|nr:two-component system sensor histidine kinase CreC [Desulfobacterales bacterium]